ncbi:MAG: metallophosphoesterase, partial [Bacteroidota bacterium]
MNQALTLFLFLFWSLGYGQDSIDYAVYLIGDSGAPKTETQDPVFAHLQERLDQEGEQSAIIFLGDNIYHNGLPPIGHDEATRRSAEAKLLVQLRAVEDFAGEIYFIPGNHDWNDAKSDGIDYIHAQEEFIEFYLDRGDVMIPDHGCPGPETKKLGKDVLLIGLDSQWWLHPHTDEQLRAVDCPNKNFGEIIDELKAILAEEDDKHIIIALHHPIYSDGSHNGDYPIEDHLFPLRAISSNFYLPLPGLGSLYPFYRSAFGAKQDMPHPLYQRLREQILDALDDHQNVVLASGHEHNQQYFALHGHHFIKSGSGSKESFLPNRSDAVFSTEKQGYAKLEYLRSGDVRLRVFTIEDGMELERYNQVIIPSRESFGQLNETYVIESDSMTTSASAQYAKKGLHKMLFGELYRDDWATDVTFRSLNLSSEKGGLQPLKVGGGFSSKSIRLRDQQGDQWVLRSVAKGVAKVVPTEFVGSLVEAIFQDQISASQPYAALMVPPLAAAVGVYHTNPELVYLPDQQLLGEYGSQYGDALYLFEERPYKDESEEEDFGYSKKIISYADLLDRLRDNSRHHVRQEQVLRSRILDIFLGDWDRHDDQWRWASFKEKTREGENHYYYEPIPRDRDQVFFKYKGVIPALTKLVTPQTRKFQNFDRDLKNVA